LGASIKKAQRKTDVAFPWASFPNMNFLAKLNQMYYFCTNGTCKSVQVWLKSPSKEKPCVSNTAFKFSRLEGHLFFKI
jgi:hypothetical protein